MVAYTTGLTAARWCARTFPAAFATCVRPARVTPAALLATIELFANLAYDRLFFFDMSGVSFAPWLDNPIAQFPHTLVELQQRDPHDLIESIWDDRDVIWSPTPEVYGLPRNPDELDLHEFPFIVAVWRLLHRTAWATIHEHEPGALAHFLGERSVAGRFVAGLKPLPAGTDIAALCAHLDRAPPRGISHLGSAMLYVAGMTGNQYADTNWTELYDWYGNYGIRWDDADGLATIREAQVEAQAIRDAFLQINAQMRQHPYRFRAVFASIHRLADEVRAAQAAPVHLIDLFAPVPTTEGPYGLTLYPIRVERDGQSMPDYGIDVLGPITVLRTSNPAWPEAATADDHPPVAAPAASASGDSAG